MGITYREAILTQLSWAKNNFDHGAKHEESFLMRTHMDKVELLTRLAQDVCKSVNDPEKEIPDDYALLIELNDERGRMAGIYNDLLDKKALTGSSSL